jgi:hypothetical protein
MFNAGPAGGSNWGDYQTSNIEYIIIILFGGDKDKNGS